MISVGDLLAVLRLRDEMSPALIIAQQNVQKAAGQLKTFGQSAKEAGTSLSIGLTAPLVAIAGGTLALSGSFEQLTTRLSSLAGVSGADLGMVKQHILDLAPAVGIGPIALATAMMKVASTVSDSKVGLEILDIAARGAAAGMGEPVQVAGALTAVINSYGAANITAARAGDILTQTIKDGGAEAAELAPTLANVVPMAAQLGISFEELGANIATVTKLGVPAAEAVTQLNAVLTASLKPTKEGGEALAKIGHTYESLRASLKEKGLMNTLVELTTKFGDNKEALAQVFGRIEALRNVMSSAGQQAGTYAEVLTNIKNSAGRLNEAFDKMKGTQIHTWAELKAQVEVIAITFGDQLAPAMKKILEDAKPLLDWVAKQVKAFADMDDSTKKWVIGGLAAVAALGPLLMLIGSMAAGIAALTTFITGPVGLVAALSSVYKFLALGLTSFPAVTLVVLALSAALIAGGNAWAWYRERQEHARSAAANLVTTKSMLAEASRVSGRAVTDEAEGIRILVLHNASLQRASQKVAELKRIETEASAKAAEGAKRNATVVAELTEAQKKAAKELEEYNKQVADQLQIFAKEEEAVKARIATMDLELATQRALFDGLDKEAAARKKVTDTINAQADAEQMVIFANLEKDAKAAVIAMNELDASQRVMFANLETDAKKAKQTLKNDLLKTLQDIPQTLANAFTGGGGIEGALKALSGTLGSKLGKMAASVFGATGPWGQAIGAAVGSLAPLLFDPLKKLFGIGVNEEVKKANDEIKQVQDSLLKTYGTMENLEEAAQRVGLSFAENWGHQGKKGLEEFNRLAAEMEKRIAAVGKANAQVQSGFAAVAAFMTKPWVALGKAIDEAYAKTAKAEEAYVKATMNVKASADEVRKLKDAFHDASDAEQALYMQQGEMAKGAKQQLADLGVQAVATFAAALIATGDYGAALAQVGPSLTTLADSYKALGLDVEDVALKHLLIQANVAQAQPQLMAAIGGLAGSMQGLAQLGLLNVDSFGAMQRTGSAMYLRLQGEVGNLGGTTRDALLPMQGYLQQAATQAQLLGLPLDANTQLLINQSKELGIWKEQGKSANDLLIEGMTAIVGKLDAMLTRLLGVATSLNTLPSPTVTITTHHIDTFRSIDLGDGGDGGNGGNGFASGTKGVTGSWFADFGAGTNTRLHGEEAVVRKDQAGAFAAEFGGGDSKALGRIERLLRDQPRAMALAIESAMALGGRS